MEAPIACERLAERSRGARRGVGGLAIGLGLLLATATSVPAQTALRLDGSLPNGRTDDLVIDQPGPIYTIDQTMGEPSGGNLFHSFDVFSLESGDTADFTAFDPFDRVIVRVTGDDSSVVNGRLRSNVRDSMSAGADFFLLNPQGIFFGAGSAIDVPGNLFLSTAETLSFDDGAVLDLTGTAGPPVLSVAEPEAFGFGGVQPAADVGFVENSTGGFGVLTLSMAPGTTLGVAGGDVEADGGNGFLSVEAPGGRIALAAVGEAEADVALDDFAISTGEPDLLGTVRATPNAQLNGQDFGVDAARQGELVIRGGRLEVDGAFLTFGGNPSSGSPAVDVRMTEAVVVRGGGFVTSEALGTPPGGGIRLEAPSIAITGAGSAVGSQNGGHIELEADAISVSDGGLIASLVDAFGPDPSIDGGDVRLVADRVEILSSGRVSTDMQGTGRAGSIEVLADRLDVADGAVVSRGNAMGRTGDVRIDVLDVSITGPAGEVSAIEQSSGLDAGSIRIGRSVGAGTVTVTNGGLVLGQTDADRTGHAVQIETGRLEVRDGGTLATSTSGPGAAGTIDLEARTIVVTRTPGASEAGIVSSFVGPGASGTGGLVQIETESFEASAGGQVSTTTAGGDAGAIALNATGSVELNGEDDAGNPSGLFAITEAGGRGGTISVEAPTISLLDGAAVSARSRGSGGSGSVRLIAAESLSIAGAGTTGSLVETRSSGAATGEVQIEAPHLRITTGGAVDVTNDGTGAGGRLLVRGGDMLLSGAGPDGVSQLAGETTSSGTGGGIDVALTGALRIEDGALVNTRSTGSGSAGDVRLEAREIRVDSRGAIRADATVGAAGGSITLVAVELVEIVDELDLAEIEDLTVEGTLSTRARAALGGRISIDAGRLISVRDASITSRVGTGGGASAGDAGDITLTAPFVTLNASGVIARAEAGDGGNIQISSEVFVPSAETVIDASSNLGVDGVVASSAPAADLSGQIANLEADFLSADDQLRRDCGMRTERAGSFTIDSVARERDFDEEWIDPAKPLGPGEGGDPCTSP